MENLTVRRLGVLGAREQLDALAHLARSAPAGVSLSARAAAARPAASLMLLLLQDRCPRPSRASMGPAPGRRLTAGGRPLCCCWPLGPQICKVQCGSGYSSKGLVENCLLCCGYNRCLEVIVFASWAELIESGGNRKWVGGFEMGYGTAISRT